MSSFGAAQVASAKIPVIITSRETLWSGAVVKMKVPVGATDGTYPDGDTDIPFLRFCQNVRGGVVNFFVHNPDPAFLGKTITAEASVLKKTLEDGREYLYVDLIPVDSEKPVTHRLAVMNNVDGSWNGDDRLIFETSAPLSGLIILAPPGAKVIVADTVVHMPQPAPKPEPAAPKKPSTGDSQLDRLLDAGWEIDSQDSTRVKLFKMKGDERKTMVHHRPKNRHK